MVEGIDRKDVFFYQVRKHLQYFMNVAHVCKEGYNSFNLYSCTMHMRTCHWTFFLERDTASHWSFPKGMANQICF